MKTTRVKYLNNFLKFLSISFFVLLYLVIFSPDARADKYTCAECPDHYEEGYSEYYLDADGDGYGDPEVCKCKKSQPSGYVTDNTDCDDTDETIYPGATEIPDDEIDQDCDDVDSTIYYRDYDEDTFGDPNNTIIAPLPDPPSGYVIIGLDCDDNDPLEHPGQFWFPDIDDDDYSTGIGLTGPCTRPAGYKVASELIDTDGDCNDGDDTINPGATENLTNCTDDDCNGYTDEIKVDCNGVYSTITKIQDGIDAASGTGCSKRVVLVYPSDTCTPYDFYRENIDFNGKDITVVSKEGRDKTTIYPDTSGSVVWFHSGETDAAVLKGFTITHYYDTTSYVGHGINVNRYLNPPEDPLPSTPTIEDCVITDNYASYGGGIKAGPGCDITVTNCEISNNHASAEGGGVKLDQAEVTFTDCQIINNTSDSSGGGIHEVGAYDGHPLYPVISVFTNCEIIGNKGRTGGGASLHNGSEAVFERCNISGNEAICQATFDGGGGFAAFNWSYPVFTNCNLVDNWTSHKTPPTSTGGDGGGGLFQSDSYAIFTNCTISGNNSVTDNGDGLAIKYCLSESSIEVSILNSIIWDNPPESGAAGIYTHSYCGTYITYSDVPGYEGNDGNINADPLFNKDENSPDTNKDDYYIVTNSDRNEFLGEDSPCIDAADSGYAPDDDRVGTSRPQGSGDDIGAYENND